MWEFNAIHTEGSRKNFLSFWVWRRSSIFNSLPLPFYFAIFSYAMGGGWKREGNLPDVRVHRSLFPRSGRRRKDPCSGESIIQGSRGTLNTSLPLVYPWGLLNSSLRYGILSHDIFPPPSSTHSLIFHFISPPSRVGGSSSHLGVMSWELGHRKKAGSSLQCTPRLKTKLQPVAASQKCEKDNFKKFESVFFHC